jgi:thioredoxin type arsenate reductase
MKAPSNTVARRFVAEALGTAFLLAAIVGSGIMGERLAGGNVAIALLANTIATGAMLVTLILTFGPISGAHFNPAVTLADASQGGLAWREVPLYLAAQTLGAFTGVAAAHLMFNEPLFSASRHARSGSSQLFSEFIATFGLLAVIWGCARLRSSAVPFAVGAYITGAYWFTSSTSFANPAVTLARAASDTFAGIRPSDAPGFIVAQLAGAMAATLLFRWLVPSLPKAASNVVVAHPQGEPPMLPKKRILILCTGNSARSQMAEGLLRHDAGDRFEVFSAGTKPSHVRPEAIAAMRELGIDIAGQRSKGVDEFSGQKFDYVLTVCDNAKESCPIFPDQTVTLHHNFEDPAAVQGSEEERLAVFRRVRDEIRQYLRVSPPR